MSRSYLCGIALIILFAAPARLTAQAPGDLRDWTVKGPQGDTRLKAKLGSLAKGAVTLVDEAGKQHAIPLASLEERKEALSRIVGSGVVVVHPKNLLDQVVGVGSGFVVRGDGSILTNYHVVRGAAAIDIEFRDQKERIAAECLAVDRACDVAVLKVARLPPGVHVLELAVHAPPKEGDAVWTIGHPRNLKNTVGWGDVNAVRQTTDLPDFLRSYVAAPDNTIWVQTDAVLAHGSSGGPLLNPSGQAIGMNTFIAGPQLGFALHLLHARQTFYEAAAAKEPLKLPLPPGDKESALAWLSRDVAPIMKAYMDEMQALQGGIAGGVNREQVLKQFRAINDRYRPKLFLVAKAEPTSWAAFQAQYYLCEMAADGSDAARSAAAEACALLGRHHAASRDLAAVVARVASLDDEGVRQFCKQVLEASPHQSVQAQAALAIATGRLQKLSEAGGLSLDEVKADRAAVEQLAARLEKDLAEVELGDFTGKQYGAQLKAQLAAVRIGQPAGEISGIDADGKEFKLSDYKGKVVVLDFFADWCQWCKKMYPQERKLVVELKDRPFALLGVNTDQHQVLNKLAEEKTVTWRCWADGQAGPIATAWQIDSYPNLYLIDHQGIVRRHFAGTPSEEEFQKAIDALLKEAETTAK